MFYSPTEIEIQQRRLANIREAFPSLSVADAAALSGAVVAPGVDEIDLVKMIEQITIAKGVLYAFRSRD